MRTTSCFDEDDDSSLVASPAASPASLPEALPETSPGPEGPAEVRQRPGKDTAEARH